MNWQKRARVIVAIIGLGCAGAVYLLLGKRLPPTAQVTAPPADPQATNETGPGDMTSLQPNGDAAWHVRFDRSSSYADGRTKFVKAHFVMPRGSQPFELWSDVAVAMKRVGPGTGPGNVDLAGHVVVETGSAWHIETDAATYEEPTSLLRMPGVVTFTHDVLWGTSHGATYNRDKQIIMLLTDPHITMKPDATGAGALDATALQITINRAAKFALLDQQARIARDKEVLSADVATLKLTEDEKSVQAVELRSRASVVPKPGATDPPPEMHADDIDLGMRPDGRTLQAGALRRRASLIVASNTGAQRIEGQSIDFRLAPDGQTISTLNASESVALRLPQTPDTGARTITAHTLTSVGDDKAGLKALLFDGGAGVVTFTENQPATAGTPASMRTGTSKLLTLNLDGGLGAITSAEFRRNVRFTKDKDVTATGERGVYFEPKTDSPARLTLYQDGSRSLPRVVNDDLTIEGELVKVDIESNDVYAKGTLQRVQTVKKPASDPAAPKPKTSIFASDQPLLGFGAEANYVSKTGEMTYTSNATIRARVQQEDGNNRVSADKVTVIKDTNDLMATGKVDSRFLTDATPAGGRSGAQTSSAPKAYAVRAATMKYTDVSRLAHYTGTETTPAELDSQDGLTRALTIDLFLDEDGRTVKRMVADGQVYTKTGTREATGDHLIWIAAVDTTPDNYTITGVPVYVKEPKDPKPEPGKPDCNWSLYISVTYSSGGDMTGKSLGQGQISHSEQSCSVKIPGGGR